MVKRNLETLSIPYGYLPLSGSRDGVGVEVHQRWRVTSPHSLYEQFVDKRVFA
jgi:hypothetical protein